MTVAGDADFTTVRAGPCIAVTVAEDGGEVAVVPLGDVRLAVAVFEIDPAFTSACVTVYVAVHVVDAPGANVVVGQFTADNVPVPEKPVSVTATPDNVVEPVFVTKNEYVTV